MLKTKHFLVLRAGLNVNLLFVRISVRKSKSLESAGESYDCENGGNSSTTVATRIPFGTANQPPEGLQPTQTHLTQQSTKWISTWCQQFLATAATRMSSRMAEDTARTPRGGRVGATERDGDGRHLPRSCGRSKLGEGQGQSGTPQSARAAIA